MLHTWSGSNQATEAWCSSGVAGRSPAARNLDARLGQTRRVLLTVSTTHRPATDLGYLLHKHPDRVQEFKQSFGTVTVF